MTLQEIKLLAAFNAWATNRVFDAVEGLEPEHYTRDLRSSHGSIHGTLVHLVGAERVWLARWTGAPRQEFLAPEEAPTLEDLKRIWNTTGFETAKFLGTLTDKKLLDTFTMTTSKGEHFTHSYRDSFLHLVDHSSYHRGQVASLMRQLGVTPPTTGMIAFFRETAKLPQR